jgi:hypothetical protein
MPLSLLLKNVALGRQSFKKTSPQSYPRHILENWVKKFSLLTRTYIGYLVAAGSAENNDQISRTLKGFSL